MDYRKDIERIIADNGLCYDWWFYSETDGIVEFNVEWGDWKHDHVWLNNVMRKNSWYLLKEFVTDEDGTDSYSSIHRYRYYVKV